MNHTSLPIASLLPGKSEGMALSDGMYAATIIGYAIKKTEFKNEDGSVRENVGASLIAQIRDDNGEIAHIATRPMAASLHEKAGLRKILSGWLKKSDLQGIIDSLINAGIIKDEVFSWDGFLGKTPLLMVSMQASKKDPKKQYASIHGFSPLKQEQRIEAIPGQIHEFFIRDALAYKLLDGFTIKQSESTAADDLPF